MEQLVNFIIRPPRAEYSPKHDLLDQEFMLKGRWFQRKDLEVTNGRGNVLQCSHYMPLEIPEGKILPCVIYCHGNSGCRADASEAAIILLPSNITVFTLDFSGSGVSEGEHVTLGWNEKDDLRSVVNHLRTDGKVSCIGLWGRSMGAVTSLMYGAEDPSIAGMVLDSPFSNLVELMMELVDTYKYPLPKFTVKLAIQHMRRVIKKKANFDIMELDAIQAAKCCYVPVLFGHATDDDFICPHHSDRIYDSYVGDKNIIKFDGDHNSPRPQFYFDSITIFFHNVLNPPKDGSDEQYLHTMHSFFDKDNWGTIHEVGNRNQNFNEPPPELATSSTEDAITQLRSRRPMSRTDVPPDISSLEKDGDERNGSECDLGPSSSRLYNDNLSNGDPQLHNQFIPTTSDDEYVEYAFDGSSDIPCSMEDEERMLMEAIMESLKDLEAKHPQEDVQPDKGTAPPEPLDGMEASTTEPNRPAEMAADSIATSDECKPIDEPTLDELESCTADSASATNSGSSKETPASGSSSDALESCTADSASAKNSGSSKETPASGSSSVGGSSVGGSSSTQDADTTSGTRATLVVQKNPAGHILDGLVNRWGFNFFKSGR